jgi:UDP-glucose 4-epimerase
MCTLAPDSLLFRGVDHVFHFGGIGDIVPSIERPLEYMRANVNGTLAVLEASRHAGVRKLVYAASSSCYGLAGELPTTEQAPVRPEYPYALSKYLGESAALHWAQVYRLPVISIRMFNVYGPRVRTTGAYGAVFGVFLAQKLHGKPYTVGLPAGRRLGPGRRGLQPRLGQSPDRQPARGADGWSGGVRAQASG